MHLETPSTTNSPPSGSANKPDSAKHDDHLTKTDSGKSKDDEVTINDEDDDDESMFDDEEFESVSIEVTEKIFSLIDF